MSRQEEDFFLSREVFETLEFRYNHPEIEDEEYTSIQREHIDTFKSVVEKIFNYFVIYTKKIFGKYYGVQIKNYIWDILKITHNLLFKITIIPEKWNDYTGEISMVIDSTRSQKFRLNIFINTTNKYQNFSTIINRFYPLKSEFKAVSELTKIAENYNKSFRLTQEEDEYWLWDEIYLSLDLWCDRPIEITTFINDATDKINKIIPSILVFLSPPNFLSINACRYLN